MLRLLCFAAVLSGLVGCSSVATRKGFYEPITAELRSGCPEAALQKLELAREDNKYAEKDRLLYFIDAGLLSHYAGDHTFSNAKLHLAEEAAEELFTKSVSRAAASFVLNDNVLEYAGEDYEILYTNLIKALNYIALSDFEAGFVEIRRANLKLELLEQKYADAATQLQRGSPDDTGRVKIDYDADKVRFHNDAFARYLSMHMYAANGKMDDARIDYDFLVEAFRSQPHIYDFPLPEVKYDSRGGAILSVVALVGLPPVKEALNLRLRTDKDLDLVQVLYDDPEHEQAEYSHLPMKVSADYYFKFSIPKLVPQPSMVGSIRVLVGGQPVGQLQLLEDVGCVAEETFAARKSLIYLRTLARAISKGLAAHKLKKEADTGGLGGWLKKAAIDIGTDLIENADLRSSQYLPGSIHVGDFELESGVHDILVEFYDTDGRLSGQSRHPGFTVSARAFNLIEVHSVD